MIPILFESTAKTFDNYGIGVLRDTMSCEITEERNGPYELTLKYPINGALYGYIKKERIIVAKPNDLAKNQAFRIYKISIPINGIITVNATHISYDLVTIGVVPFSLTNSSILFLFIIISPNIYFYVVFFNRWIFNKNIYIFSISV